MIVVVVVVVVKRVHSYHVQFTSQSKNTLHSRSRLGGGGGGGGGADNNEDEEDAVTLW